ncbi:MAG TPA: TRAP transporter large permease subunit [Deltaproteobacteria bacterium]|nr:TRAP transporter large permease subunit [Deltaproteobacteria bacterium]HPJ95193.1 TRAP transporter large permease subunit [Deltaproteobacteria bacterium]HPR52881.1 TRAP transporter large permease subunit [Deltaproteobacteria bacterium]
MTTLVIILIVLMAVMGAPVFVVLSSFAIVGFYLSDIQFAALIVDIYSKFSNNPVLYTIPIFTFAGYILAESKASVRIVNFSQALFGWLPGGLAIVSLVACAFFTAFTGASGVTIIALGGLLYPALVKEHYQEKFSLGLLTSSGSLGLLFFPSLPIIIYGVVSETSITQLFAAGLIPGIFLIVILSIYSIFVAKRAHLSKTPFSLRELVRTARQAKWELFIPVILIVGIFGGFVTLGEIASITVAYALIVEVLIHKDIRLGYIPTIMHQSMVLVGGIFIIFGSALALTTYMIDAEIPLITLNYIQAHISSKIVFLIALNIFLLIVGCIMDIYSALVVVVPLIVPIAMSYEINPVHLGIIFLTNLEIGYSTPPVGMNLFISCIRFDKSVITLYRAAVPFILILLIGLLVITYVPELSLWLIERFGIK